MFMYVLLLPFFKFGRPHGIAKLVHFDTLVLLKLVYFHVVGHWSLLFQNKCYWVIEFPI